MLGDQLAPCGDAVSCGCGCGGNGCCTAWVLRKGYPFKKRLTVKNKTTGAPIDFTGKRVIAQFRAKRASDVALINLTTETGEISLGNGYVEFNLSKIAVEALPFSNAIVEIAVEWVAGVPEFQFSTTARVDRALIPVLSLLP